MAALLAAKRAVTIASLGVEDAVRSAALSLFESQWGRSDAERRKAAIAAERNGVEAHVSIKVPTYESS